MKFWKSAIGRYVRSVLVSIDQLGNVVFHPLTEGKVGNPDQTISMRLGLMELRYGNKIPWFDKKWPYFHGWDKILALSLNKIQKDHCLRAIEWDEIGEEDIVVISNGERRNG